MDEHPACVRPPRRSGERGLSANMKGLMRQGLLPVHAFTRALEFEKSILGMQPSLATGVGFRGLEGWPKALELGKCIREGASGPRRVHWGSSCPLGRELGRAEFWARVSIYYKEGDLLSAHCLLRRLCPWRCVETGRHRRSLWGGPVG